MTHAYGSTYGSDDDWRSQMDSKYTGSEYSDLVSFSSKVHFGVEPIQEFSYSGTAQSGANKEVFDAIRFPPVPSVQLPDEVYKRDYEQDFELRASFRPTQNSVEDNDSIAALDFLEGLLQTAVDKAVDVRSSILENGGYIVGLSRTPDPEEVHYMKSIIAENLNTLREESLALMTEMESFQPDNIAEMVYLDIPSSNITIQQLKQSLEDRANSLKSEIAASALVVDGLYHYSNALIGLPDERVCKIDGIFLDWSIPRKLQDKIQASNRSLNFADFMKSHGYPVCNDVYSYLQSTKSHGKVLSVCNYNFKVGEFKLVMEFLDLQNEKSSGRLAGRAFLSAYRSVQSLVFQHCELSDRDCHALATRLHRFGNLLSLNLRDNRISISGVGSIAAALFEHGSSMRSLRLDNNLIKTDGALFIAQVLHRMPFLEILSLSGNPIRDRGLYYLLKYSLNPLRLTHGKLYKPSLRMPRMSIAGSSMWDEEGGDGEGEGEEMSEVEDAQDAVADIPLDSPQKRFLRRRITKRCYYDDYFKSHYSLRGRREAEQAEDDDEEAFGIAEREKAQWINKEEDEFNMDTRSEYSEDDGEHTVDSNRSNIGSLRDTDFGDSSTLYSNVTAAALENLNIKRQETYGDCRLLVQIFMKIRVKLVAVSAFTRQLRTGNVLTSLGVADCKLTADVVSTIAEALLDNHHIISLDASHNPDLLNSLPACQTMSHLLEKGALTTLLLNDCGVNDRGFNELTRGASLSRTIRNLELSGNHVGPTGANWAATANTVFYMDTLEISGGYHSSAPFKKKGDPAQSSVFDEFESRPADSTRAGSDEGKGGDAGDGYGSDLDSYLDTDLFDGEDEEAFPDDLVSLDQSAGDEDVDDDGYIEDMSEAQLDDDATVGASTIASRSAVSRSTANTHDHHAHQPRQRRGIVSYIRRGLRGQNVPQVAVPSESDVEHR